MKKIPYLSCEELKTLTTLLLEDGELEIKTDESDYVFRFGKGFILEGEVKDNGSHKDSELVFGSPKIALKLSDFINLVKKQVGNTAGELRVGNQKYPFTSPDELLAILFTIEDVRKKVQDCHHTEILSQFEDFLVSLLNSPQVSEEDEISAIIRAVRKKEREQAEIEEQKGLTEIVKELDKKVQEKATPIRLVLYSLVAFFTGVVLTATYIEHRIQKEETQVFLKAVKPQPKPQPKKRKTVLPEVSKSQKGE